MRYTPRKQPHKPSFLQSKQPFILFLGGMLLGVISILGLTATRSDLVKPFLQGSVTQISFIGDILGQNDEIDQLQAQTNKQWFLLGEEFTADDYILEFSVLLSEDQESLLLEQTEPVITYTIEENQNTGTLSSTFTTARTYRALINTQDFSPGEYTIRAQTTVEENLWESQPLTFYVSYPLYVTWTIDWEGYDVKQQYLNDMEGIANQHEIPMTHFFNPRIYTNKDIPQDRAEYLTQWVINRKNEYGDDIGLHLHMFPDMVTAAGVDPIEDPEHWGSNLTDGYDILASNYGYDDMVKILQWSKSIFQEQGLGTPIIYRTGGWYADAEVLKAVNDTGFVLDSSGRTPYNFGKNQVSGFWNLTATTQPYQPSVVDQNQPGTPSLNIWEFPNNGADSWMYSAEEMINRFNANYNEKVMTDKRIVTFLSHPEWFDTDKPKMEQVLTYTDGLSYTNDLGPVVYVTLEDAYNIWK